MIRKSNGRLVAITFLISLLLSGCGSNSAPNHTWRGKVTAVARVSPGCTAPKIFHFLFGCGPPSYRIDLSTPDPIQLHVAAQKVSEEDMRSIIDKNVEVACYRASEERRNVCTEWATSLKYNGRELVR